MRGLTLKQLEAVKAIARYGAVTAAAAAKGITPSAMTTRLKELEANCGFALFDRTVSGFQLNRAGMVVLGMADQIQAAIEAAESALAGLSGLTAGALVIGITSTAKYFAPRLIADFARRFPAVDITLSVGNRQEVLNALQRFSVDIVIMGRPPEHIELISEPFGDHPLVLVGPPDHPLVGRRGLTKADVVAGPFLMREDGSGTRTVFEEFFGPPVNRRTRFGIEIGSNETIKQGVMAGLGIALISAHTVAFEIQTGRLAVIDVAGLPICRKWFVAYHASKTVLPAMRAFWDFTLAEGASHLPESLSPGSAA
jgi:DNA-binding transcriptional LysR family regulator